MASAHRAVWKSSAAARRTCPGVGSGFTSKGARAAAPRSTSCARSARRRCTSAIESSPGGGQRLDEARVERRLDGHLLVADERPDARRARSAIARPCRRSRGSRGRRTCRARSRRVRRHAASLVRVDDAARQPTSPRSAARTTSIARLARRGVAARASPGAGSGLLPSTRRDRRGRTRAPRGRRGGSAPSTRRPGPRIGTRIVGSPSGSYQGAVGT